MHIDTLELLEGFGYDSHTAHLIAIQAHKHGLTPADVATWLYEAENSRTIRNPRGFVRARITNGDKPPLSRSSRSTHLPDFHEKLGLLCPDCQTRPCVCDWDPEIETFTDFRERIIKPTGGTEQ